MQKGDIDVALLERLQARVGKTHLRQRLGLEAAHLRRAFGQGRTFFHIENLIFLRAVIRNALRLALLHGRAQRNARRIELRHNHVTIPGLPGAFEGFTLLQLSDLHLDMAPDMPHAIGAVVRDVTYDLCVLTGDYRAETWGPYDAALAGLQQVRAQLGDTVYGILGNHDSICMLPGIEALGVRMLMNEFVTVERGGERLYLAGIDDPHFYRADNLEKAADAIPDGAVSILLAHSPEIYRHAAHADFNLMLCGHTHGGQICLPGGIPLMCNADCPRTYCAGAWAYEGMAGYTSSGTGVSVVDVRLNCPPEITLHHLHGA